MTFRLIALLVGSVLLGAAALAAVEPFVAIADAAACSVHAARPWSPVKGRVYRTEAFANGGACATAVVTIVVRAMDGAVLWADVAPAQHLMTFGGVKTRSQMFRALQEWLTQGSMFKTSADLPPWAAGADAPASGEFPFHPEADIDRDSYERMRAERQPVFCYVQGMESMTCLGLSKDGDMTKIGVQQFPG